MNNNMADAIYQPQTQVKCLEGCGVISSNDNPVIAAGDAAGHASFYGHIVITQSPYEVTVYNREGVNRGSFTLGEWEKRESQVEAIVRQPVRVECR